MELKKNEKKYVMGFAISLILLIGSLIVIGSDNANEAVASNQLKSNENCLGNCDDCDTQCNGDGQGVCDESGTCSQSRAMNKKCKSDCSESGTCSNNMQQLRKCASGSGCSVSCNN